MSKKEGIFGLPMQNGAQPLFDDKPPAGEIGAAILEKEKNGTLNRRERRLIAKMNRERGR